LPTAIKLERRRRRRIVAVAELFGMVAGRTSSGRLMLIRSVFYTYDGSNLFDVLAKSQ